MADPSKPTGVRDEILVVGWDAAVAIAAQGKATAWTSQGRIHVYIGDGGPWEEHLRPLSDLDVEYSGLQHP